MSFLFLSLFFNWLFTNSKHPNQHLCFPLSKKYLSSMMTSALDSGISSCAVILTWIISLRVIEGVALEVRELPSNFKQHFSWSIYHITISFNHQLASLYLTTVTHQTRHAHTIALVFPHSCHIRMCCDWLWVRCETIFSAMSGDRADFLVTVFIVRSYGLNSLYLPSSFPLPPLGRYRLRIISPPPF